MRSGSHASEASPSVLDIQLFDTPDAAIYFFSFFFDSFDIFRCALKRRKEVYAVMAERGQAHAEY